MDPLRHLPDLLHSFNERPRQSQAFNYMKDGQWFHLSTEQVVNQVESLALYLKDQGLKKGERVGIYAKSSPYWSIIDFAVTLAGGITVPFFANLSGRHFVYEVEQSKPKWLFVGDREDWDHIKEHKEKFETTIGIEQGAYEHTDHNFYDWVEKGMNILKETPYQIEILKQAIHPDDVATIIYSSGSTGSPKGVELTHRNLVSIVNMDDFLLRGTDKYLSILPLAHIFSKQIHLIMTAWGVPIYFLNDLTKITEVATTLPITRMIVVPRILEKVYSKMLDSVKKSSLVKRLIGTWAFNLAYRKNDWIKRSLFPIADQLVYSKIRSAFGPHFHSILSGGAPLNPHLHRFYLSVGIPILQGWGLTEGSCIAVNRLHQNKVGTVGPPVPGVRFKISEDGEILAHSPTVMKGYYLNPEATRKTIDPEGWLHTGDYGYIDNDGHLVVQGRINEAFKTSQGEYVSPVPIEQRLSESPLIDMAMVIGEGRPFPAVLLFPDFPSVENWKAQKSQGYLSVHEFLDSEEINQEIIRLIEEINQSLDHWQKIRAYRFILTPPTIDGMELTPTLKLRRKAILEKYASVVEEIYHCVGKRSFYLIQD